MRSHHVFRAYVIVIREDILFNVRDNGQFKLGGNDDFILFMDMVCDDNIPVHLIVVPSPCYDDM